MVAQLREPVQTIPWLIAPECPPPVQRGQRVGGYTHGRDGIYRLNPVGESHAGIAQRILIRYVLGYEDRAQLARRYGYSQRFIQGVVTGEHFRFLSLPVRRRLLASGIGNIRMNRSEHRPTEVLRALQKLAARAALILRDPSQSASEEAQLLSVDLFLLSGAWREDEP